MNNLQNGKNSPQRCRDNLADRSIISINKNYEFQRLYRRGESAAGAYFVLYARRNGKNINRLGITVSKKVGKAVQRNRAKRRLKELYRTNLHRLKKGYDIVIVARESAVAVEHDGLKRAYFWAIRKTGVANDGEGKPKPIPRNK